MLRANREFKDYRILDVIVGVEDRSDENPRFLRELYD